MPSDNVDKFKVDKGSKGTIVMPCMPQGACFTHHVYLRSETCVPLCYSGSGSMFKGVSAKRSTRLINKQKTRCAVLQRGSCHFVFSLTAVSVDLLQYF